MRARRIRKAAVYYIIASKCLRVIFLVYSLVNAPQCFCHAARIKGVLNQQGTGEKCARVGDFVE